MYACGYECVDDLVNKAIYIWSAFCGRGIEKRNVNAVHLLFTRPTRSYYFYSFYYNYYYYYYCHYHHQFTIRAFSRTNTNTTTTAATIDRYGLLMHSYKHSNDTVKSYICYDTNQMLMKDMNNHIYTCHTHNQNSYYFCYNYDYECLCW